MSKMRSLPVRVEKVSDRVREFVASTGGVASDCGIVRVAGWRFTRYEKNPVFLWAHNRGAPPIAKGIAWGVKPEADEMRVRVEWPPEGVYPFADLILRLFEGGFLSMVSVSWETLQEGRPTPEEVAAGCRWVSEVQELLELSAVPIGADPKALDVTGRIADAVAARTLRDGDPALIRASMAGIGAWDALASAIDGALKARAEPAATASPPAPPKPPAPAKAGWGELFSELFGNPAGPVAGSRADVEALAARRGLDLPALADELRSLAIRLATMADLCEGESAEPAEEPPEFPEGKPDPAHAEGVSPGRVNSPLSPTPAAPTVAPDAGEAEAFQRLHALAREYAGRA